MKNLILGVAAIFAMNGLQSCSGTRPAAGPIGGPATGYGPASNISAGRTDASTASNQQLVKNTPDTVAGTKTIDKDSLARKVEGARGDQKLRQFVIQATSSGRTAIGLSEYALNSAQNTNVKAFASMVLDNQKKAGVDLKSLALAKNVGMDSLKTDSVRNEKVKELTTVTGEELETHYVQAMIALQDQTVKLYEEGADSKDPEVKAYAKKYLPSMKIQQKAITAFTDKR